MIYFLISRKNLNNVNQDNCFNVIKQKILKNDYVLVVTNKTALDLKGLFLINNVSIFPLFPYVSVELFNETYGDDYATKHEMNMFEIDYSVFNFLMYNNQNIIPEQNKKHYLLSDLMSNINQEEYLEDLADLKEFLKDNGLLLNMKDFLPSLDDILAESIEKIIKEETEDEILTIKDLEHQSEMYNINVVTDFLLRASRVYPKHQVRKYIAKEFNFERK